MGWFLYCIARHPQQQQLLFEEMNDIFEDAEETCTPQHVSRMKYLECCIKETLRLYPSIPGVMRTLTQEVQIGTVQISRPSFALELIFILKVSTRYRLACQLPCSFTGCTTTLPFTPSRNLSNRSGSSRNRVPVAIRTLSYRSVPDLETASVTTWLPNVCTCFNAFVSR